MAPANILKLSAMRERIRNWARILALRSRYLQRLYGFAEVLLGRVELSRKRFFRAAEHFCKASRRVEFETPSRNKARAQIRAILDPPFSDGILDDFLKSRSAAAYRARFGGQPFPLNVTIRDRLIPLKAYNSRTGERGVLIMKYNYIFEAFHALYRTRELAERYWMILEPSYHRFWDPAYTLFGGWRVVLEDRNPIMRSDMKDAAPPFETVPLNSGDWVDPDIFRPLRNCSKKYDLIMVSNWSRNKRHDLLFRTLAKIRRPLRVALVGFPWERTVDGVMAEMKKFGVADQCDIFERLPAERINELLNQSRANLMLSEYELANKALYEAMFADVPSLISRNCAGLDLSQLSAEVGLLAGDEELGDAISTMIEQQGRFAPREWALQHTGYLKSTRVLNDKLRDLSVTQGWTWTGDIAPKVNRPDLAYKLETDRIRLQSEMSCLEGFLRGSQRAQERPM